MEHIMVKKKDGTLEHFDFSKIVIAVNKSAERANKEFGEGQLESILYNVEDVARYVNPITVEALHEIVIESLKDIDNETHCEYLSYRDYKQRFNKTFEKLLDTSKHIIYNGTKENANKDSQLISTKKELISGEESKLIMLEYEYPKHISKAHKDGDIHIHDLTDRLYGSINCCLFDMANVLKNGFKLNGVVYTEPTSAESCMGVIADVVLQASSQQYGGQQCKAS